MSIDSLPLEILHKIIRDVEVDTIPPDLPAADRLERVLALTHINRTLRIACQGCHSLWSSIFLQWPAGAVEHFLSNAQRPANPDLVVILDTRASGTNDKRRKQRRWARFLEEHMEIIRVLEVRMTVNHGSPGLSAALCDTPAPRLVIFTLDLDQQQTRNANIHRLFNNDAPFLSSARLHACTPFDGLQNFASLVNFAYRVTENNFRGLVDMLGGMPQLESISLKGATRWHDSPLPTHNPPLQPIVLPSCRTLSIRGMNAQRTRYILSKINIPNVSHLDVHETIAEHDNGLVATIFDTLPKLPHIPQLPQEIKVLIIFHSTSLLVGIKGYHFQTDWTNLTFQQLEGPAVFPLLFNVLAHVLGAPAHTLHLQPSSLHIENFITIHEGVGLHLSLPTLNILVGWIFELYPSVQILTLSGNTAPITQAFQQHYSHLLPHLATLNLERSMRDNSPPTPDNASLAILKQTRQLEIQIQGTAVLLGPPPI
ncbi:hypothetical protein SISNIDRAFT_553509 [Sistotremastrum niveocremeum HHB9708]|uniref:F-box domain-containing protein n=1 Tax=Sistotremastrum niveocremeum HHB9708 TaxID=1314777 RepID=A0A164MEV6_9AGAM|nr:hypothetical protein SISNIDRAFT_553509 [Sistotremastrum niveocremeum HHB9708]